MSSKKNIKKKQPPLVKEERAQEEKPRIKKISMALQGGGSHGAFGWGVLDRFLEERQLHLEGLAGSSGGGLNALCVAQGLMEGGPARAQEVLRSFWEKIIFLGKNSFLNNRTPVDKLIGKFNMHFSPGFVMFDYLSRLFSPYELNPLHIDPLRDIFIRSFDFEKLRDFHGIQVFLYATHVLSGKLRTFDLSEISIDCIQAVSCCPSLHNAVKVDEEYYWDGGMMGNPVLEPLVMNCETSDIFVIPIIPERRHEIPTTNRDIDVRTHEIATNTALSREMRNFQKLNQMVEDGIVPKDKIKPIYLHKIEDKEIFQDLKWSSRLNTECEFINYLHDRGYLAADNWIKENSKYLGEKTTAVIEEPYMNKEHLHKKTT